MSKPTSLPSTSVNIATAVGIRLDTIPAWEASKHFVVHPPFSGGVEGAHPAGPYVLTHTQTGLAAHARLVSLEDAVALAAELEECIDWSLVDSRTSPLVVEHKPALSALVHKYDRKDGSDG